jgi:signal transduction histidine kinase
MRGIFPRLLLSFILTFLLAGLLSGLVVFSISRSSVESFRNHYRQQFNTNIAHSVALTGQAAYMMWEHWGEGSLIDYTREIESSMQTRLYLVLDGKVLPSFALQESTIRYLTDKAAIAGDQPTIVEENGTLQVLQRLQAPEGATYVVIGLHQIGPHPPHHIPPPPPKEYEFGMPPPHELEFLTFFGWLLGYRSAIFLPLAGIFCYLLARSFSAPINRLRRVSRQIAEGDFTARVGASLGKPGNEIGDLGREFDLMADQMERMVNEQRRLLLDISHELRSPLARLKLSLELGKKCCPDNSSLSRIGREADRMNILIEQLLSLNRSATTPPATDAPLIPLVPLLQEIAEDVDFEHHGKATGVKLLELVPLSVAGSRQLLREAIENVVRNGAYYTSPGTRVEIGLSSRTDSQGERSAVIIVRDYGPGVAEDKLPLLTEPFYRVAEARERNSGGVGLGLAIAKQAIVQHGGTLRFANTHEGSGLVAEIELPVAESPSENHHTSPSSPPSSTEQPATFS